MSRKPNQKPSPTPTEPVCGPPAQQPPPTERQQPDAAVALLRQIAKGQLDLAQAILARLG